MGSSDEQSAPQLFGAESLVPPRPGWSSRWAGVGALVLLGAVVMIGRTSESPVPQPLPVTVAPVPVDVAPPTRFSGSDVIVAPTTSGVVAISAVTGDRHEFVLDPPIRSVAVGPGSTVILTDALGELLVLDLASQQVDHVGEADRSAIEASLRPYQPSAAFLGDHRLLIVAGEFVLGEICDERRCRLEQRPVLAMAGSELGGSEVGRPEPQTSWEPTPPRPAALIGMTASADGKWFTTNDGVLVLYRTDHGGVSRVHTAALASGFSTDGTALYVVTGSRLEAVDLVGYEDRSIDIGRLPILTGDAIVVAA